MHVACRQRLEVNQERPDGVLRSKIVWLCLASQHPVADVVPPCLRPYIKDAQRILTRARANGSARITQSKLNFLHLAIIDGSIQQTVPSADWLMIAVIEFVLERSCTSIAGVGMAAQAPW